MCVVRPVICDVLVMHYMLCCAICVTYVCDECAICVMCVMSVESDSCDIRVMPCLGLNLPMILPAMYDVCDVCACCITYQV